LAKHWETFDHPADIGLAARGDSLGELLEALGEGLARQTCPGAVSPTASKTVSVEADDVESLTVDFLGELLRLFELQRFLIARVRVTACDRTSVSAELDGETYDPARHELDAEVKAVTYHQLTIGRQDDGWVGRVILDV